MTTFGLGGGGGGGGGPRREFGLSHLGAEIVASVERLFLFLDDPLSEVLLYCLLE